MKRKATGTQLRSAKRKIARKWLTKPKRASLFVPRRSLSFASGFPQRIRMAHRYCETISVTPGAGAVSHYLFSCNGMFDPNITGTGHQPLFFDQMTAIYDHYTVLRSKIALQVVPRTGTSSAFEGIVGIYLADSTATTGTVNSLVEQPSSHFLYFPTAGTPPESRSNTLVTHQWDAFKAFGSRALSDSELRGTSAANPTEQTYFHVYMSDPLGAAATTFDFNVLITYEAEWTELATQGAS